MKELKKFKGLFPVLLISSMLGSVACNDGAGKEEKPDQVQASDFNTRFNIEVKAIDTLLRDEAFAEYIARSLDSAYYKGIGEPQPTFLKPADATAVHLMPVKDEKIATSIAGFYALECGLGLLCDRSNETIVAWLNKIVDGKTDAESMLLLNRFANATWKAGQPFRDMARLKRYNFTAASLLSAEEVAKDSIQIVNAAKKLLALMQPVAAASQEEQMKFLRNLLKDTAVAEKFASYSDSAFAVSQGQPAASNNSPSDAATVKKTVRQMKIATSMAGFLALECGLNYLATSKKTLPSQILDSLVQGSLSEQDKMVFARFANATWKAGQPFRGLERITRETFTPFYFLNKDDIEKDLVQVRAAGAILQQRLLSLVPPNL